jgi:glycosyltransferase involved in cell wall biosynthesis
MKNNHFIILVTVHNSVQWIGKCLDSVISQDYKNYTIVVVDDHSTDGTWDIICKYDTKSIRNDVRLGHSLPNMETGIKLFSLDKEDIIITLDGDDWFSDNQVLSYLNEVYQENIWLTYGQYAPASGTYANYCRPLYNTQQYRRSGVWITSHLRSFKQKLWNLIDPNDFKIETGEYLPTCGDVAFMYPMIEMAGMSRIKFISRVLYIYNDLNPHNDMKKYPELMIRTAAYLQNKPVYKEIIGEI